MEQMGRSGHWPCFLAAGGEMARRIGAHDWSTTPIGPIEQWSASLRHTVSLMLESPTPLVLLWGELGVMIYNDAYSAFAGGRDSGLLGSAVREGWGEVADFNDNVMRVCLAGGRLSYKDQELTLYRQGFPEQVFMNLDYSPVRGDDGEPAGVLAVVVETTELHAARDDLHKSQIKLQFFDDLGRAVIDCRGADEILAITTRMTAEHLGLSNCAYADMDEDQNGFTIRGDWNMPGTISIVGHYELADFGTLAVRELGAGRPLIINDNKAELLPEEARTFQDIGIAATICIPLVKHGRLMALMAVHDKVPHRWSDYELSVIREVTERSWAHVQRVGAESTMRAREARYRQILDSATDYGIVATDADGLITLWNFGASTILGWTEAEMLGQPMATFFTAEDRAAGRPAAKRAEALMTGHAHDARWHVKKSGDRFWGLSEMTLLHDDTGAPVGFVKLIHDRTREYEAEEALRVSEDRLRRAQVAGGVGLFAIDIAARMISGTAEFCNIFGIERCSQVSTQVIENLVIPEDRDRISNDARRRDGSADLDVVYRVRRADTNEVRTIARKAEYEFDEAGVPVRLIGVVQDVTERLRIQLALERSEAQFSALAQHMPNQVWTARADGSFDWFNDRVYAYSGAEPGSLEGRGWYSLVYPDDMPQAAARWASAVERGEVYEAELRLRGAQGAYRWHLTRAVPLTDASGAITAWVGTHTEIEAQKQAEAAFSQDRDRLWAISQDILLVCDYEGRITAINPSAQRMLGWAEEEMVGHLLTDFVHPDDLSVTVAEIGKIAKGAATLAFENRYRTREGQYRLLDWTAVPDGTRIHGVGRDITEHRAVEDALRQSQKMEAVGQLTGGIAHDFNNLLQGISGSLDIMQSRIAHGRMDDLTRWLTGARNSADRAAALTHRLLAFSRRQPLDPRPVRANPLITSMEDMLRRTLGEHVALQLMLGDDLWLTRCDPNQLESAILNLVINARDAMPGGGTLTVESFNAHLDSRYLAEHRDVTPGEYVCICVSDTGMGMTKDTIARAFEPFFTTKPIGQGTGLGLSMIYGFTRQSEGYVRIYSEIDKGTSIKIYLPRHPDEVEAEAVVPTLSNVPGSDAGETVLVIEDEAVVRRLIVEILGELGYRAIEADDGPKGLDILQSEQRIDLLITDIGLPGLNGRQVADAARVTRPGLKVLFMTGYAENAAVASGFLEPGMAMITKPFAMDFLVSRIHEILEGGSSERQLAPRA
ncbi:PAS domain S-box protein [Sphingobium sp. H39-3-25]|uniref:PAS domain S-box protein n=1 Tax=Sphingobium arseniciresistens TaxID=3030834 RepID=UPI0023BA0FC2|nr:PAS domain S-box protein [Sphingobium arseniciresistens]